MQSANQKRTLDLEPLRVQQASRQWWTANPMAYDWHGEVRSEPYSADWFDAIDGRFIAGSRLYATDKTPFDRLIPYERLAGRRVLEIGCGMGFHTELLCRSGASVTSVDLTDTAVQATSRRLALRGLSAAVQRLDAEYLPFEPASFDFVWTWGVIHHSSRTGRIVREIARVLRPEGECRAMVYNREGMVARVAFAKDFILKGGFLNMRFDEILFRSTDGFSARFYTQDQIEDLFRTFFDKVDSEVLGQESDVVPLPRRLRALVLPLLSNRYARAAQARRGAFLFVTALGQT